MITVMKKNDYSDSKAGLQRLINLCNPALISVIVLLLVLLAYGIGFSQNFSDQKQVRQGVTDNQTLTSQSVINSLTATERVWLREHPVVRVIQDPGWPPVEFVNENGEPSGMSRDYLNLVEQRLGVKFELVHGLSWQEAYARLRKWEIDMTTSVAETPERKEFWAFTKPYMKIPIVIVVHADVTYIADMHELAGKKVAVVDGYAVNEWIPRDFPDIQLVKVSSVKEGLVLLQKGKVFAYIENMLVVGHYITKFKMFNLKIAGETPYDNAQSMAVRKDWAPLAGILQKALDSISETEQNEIYRKWLPIRYEHGFDYTLLWYALGIFALILLGLAAWNWKLYREIRSRKEAEAALLNSEDKFRVVFESANVGKSITLPTGEINVNQALCDMLGYTREELKGKKWQDITPLDEFATTQKQFDMLLQDKKDSVRFNKRYIHKNGSHIWADVSVVAHRDFDRNPLFLITTIIDITERKRAEEGLRKSEASLREAQTCAHLGNWEIDITAETLFWSAEMFRIFERDYSLGPPKLNEFVNIVHPDDRERINRNLIQNITEHKSYNDEYRLVRADGSVRWIAGQGKPVFDDTGNMIQFIGTAQDITERKRAESQGAIALEALQESEGRYRSLIENANEAIYIAQDNMIKFINRAGVEMSGYSKEEIISKPFIEFIHPDDHAILKERYLKRLSGEELDVRYTFRFISKNGDIKWLEVGAALITYGGKPASLNIVTDMTERKRVEEEIIRLNTRLEKKVAERTHELHDSQSALLNLVDDLNQSSRSLISANQALEAVNKELASFSYSVSHDLRAPLRSIDGFSQALLEDCWDRLNDDGKKYLERIRKATQNMGRLIDDMLNMSSVTQSEFCLEPVDLSKMVHTIADTNQQNNVLNGLMLNIQEGIIIRGDQRLMNIALTNLLDNAWKFTGKQEHPHIEFGAIVKDGKRIIFVRDNGAGFDMKYAVKLFGTFQRLHRADEFPGTGVGLAIVLRVINRHGGKVWAESEVGKGTTFFFTLPE